MIYDPLSTLWGEQALAQLVMGLIVFDETKYWPKCHFYSALLKIIKIIFVLLLEGNKRKISFNVWYYYGEYKKIRYNQN